MVTAAIKDNQDEFPISDITASVISLINALDHTLDITFSIQLKLEAKFPPSVPDHDTVSLRPDSNFPATTKPSFGL